MAECAHLARTSAYFDGALPEAEHAEVLAHVETCAECQRHLLDAATLDAVISQAPARSVRTRRWWPAVAVGVAAAAVVAVYLAVPRTPPKPAELALALPHDRAIEARFTGDRFAAHRPYGALRGDHAHEAISLATLAELEKQGDTRDLIAALVASGDIARARELAARLPADAAGDSDRAAVELAAGDSEQALARAYAAIDRAPELAAAWWNLALAARDRELPYVSRAAFAKVLEHDEPGWTDEARVQIAALDRELDRRGAGFTAFTERGAKMVQGGPVIALADVQRFPTYARLYLLDALRTGVALDAVRPLAAELDARSGIATMAAAIERASGDPKLRARFVDGYRALVAHTATPAQIEALLAQLRAAGHAVDDIRAGALILAGPTGKRLDELAALVAPWHDPWFDLYVAREQVRARWPIDDARAEPALVAALAGCSNDAWALRCGQLAYDLAARDVELGRDQDAEHWAEIATQRHQIAGTPYLPAARALLADTHRHLGRMALARAEFDEVVRSESSCDRRRFAQIGEADIALVAGQWATVRATLPAAKPEPGCAQAPDVLGLSTAVDLARRTSDPQDLARAREWIETGRELADGGIAIVAAGRLARGKDPDPVRAWIAAHASSREPLIASARAWGVTTLIADAGASGDWPGVVASAALEHGVAPTAPCVVVASFDDGVLTIAAKTEATTLGVQRTIAMPELASVQLVPPAIVDAVKQCTSIAVAARPPLHGRSDLLPATLPWTFVGDTPTHAPVAGPAKSVDVSDAHPPDPSLSRLAPATASETFDVRLTGADATPARLLAALADATYAELHVHGVAAATKDDATYLALSPDRDGQFALRADAVRTAKLGRAPVVVLAACRAAAVGPYLRQRWSLPDAFLAAGASAVVAADVAIPDASARRVFDALHRRLSAGEPIEAAVAALRAAASGDTAWAAHLMVFR